MKFFRVIIISGEVLLVILLLFGIFFKITSPKEDKEEVRAKKEIQANFYESKEEGIPYFNKEL